VVGHQVKVIGDQAGAAQPAAHRRPVPLLAGIRSRSLSSSALNPVRLADPDTSGDFPSARANACPAVCGW
jgi:hypothetical protein